MSRLIAITVCALALAMAAPNAHATTMIYQATLDGPSEAPPNASPGTGNATLTIDLTAATMRLEVMFSDLIGNSTIAHIHGPTTDPGTGVAGVITPLPTFPGFPVGVISGTYDMTFDLDDASTYNPAFVTANGGTVASAKAAFLAAVDARKTYFNLHTTQFPGGEIRGFFAPVPEPSTLCLVGLGLIGLVATRRKWSR